MEEDPKLQLILEQLHNEVVSTLSCVVQLYSVVLPLASSIQPEKSEEFWKATREFEKRMDVAVKSLDDWRQLRGQ